MSTVRRAWVVWKCWKCERRHKNEIYCGVMQTPMKYIWKWECDKCRKINVIDVNIKTHEDYGAI